MAIENVDQKYEVTVRFRLIRNCMLLSGISVFAQLYLFQPILSDLCRFFSITPATSSLTVSITTVGIAVGLLYWAFKADSISREKLMGISLILSSVITIVSAFVGNYFVLLVLSLIKGITLAGVSGVALAYLSEEVDTSKIGLAISLYLSGNTLGGMLGRVVATLVAGYGGWQLAVLFIGIGSLIVGGFFCKMIPAGKNFSATPFTFRQKIAQMRSLLIQPIFISMYMIAALSMGIFVSVYNYLSFLLESPLFALPHHLVAMIFMMYIAGIIGSVVAGSLSDKFAPEILLQGTLLLMGIGMSCLLVMKLWIIVLGLGILTFSFFGTHTLASRIISIHAQNLKSSATCIYWLFYYLGSSLIGSLTGIVFVSNGWFSLVEILLLLLLGALIIASLFIFKYRFYEKSKVYSHHQYGSDDVHSCS